MHKKLFGIFSAVAILIIMLPSTPACSARSSGGLSFDELTSHPADYNAKTVTFEAFVFTGFEISALSSGLTHPAASDRWTPIQPLIWLSGNIPQAVLDRLYTQTQTPSGYDEHYGKIRVTGTFEYGGKYGHLDSYNFRLTATDAMWIDWTPAIK